MLLQQKIGYLMSWVAHMLLFEQIFHFVVYFLDWVD